MRLNNLKDYAKKKYPFWVITLVDSEACFYGGYETEERCKEVIEELEPTRFIVRNPDFV